ncbi:MAG: CtsR family transcriptional regulator [Bacillota bacterium]
MSKISDIIELFIKELLDEANHIAVEIQRNELANYFNCAPSQINYVLMTRFTADKGYLVESRRGGGGYIKIIEVNMDKNTFIRNIIREIGDSISKMQAFSIVDKLVEKSFISEREGRIIQVALDDRSITVPINIKDQVRANMLKNILTVLFIGNGRG